jgi:hypothetical protein
MSRARIVIILLAAAALAVAISACGSTDPHEGAGRVASRAHGGISTAPPTEPVAAPAAADRDHDGDSGSADIDPANALGFAGRASRAPDRTAITALIKRYYAAALAQDGAKACGLFYSPLVEAAAEDYGVPGGPRYALGAKSCPEVATDVFHHFHAALVAEVPRLRVLRVLVRRRQGAALVGFGPLPERELSLILEGRRWRVSALGDRELP